MGTDLFAHHLPPGVASVHAVPDHDPEGRRRNPANGTLDTVRPAAQDYHPCAPDALNPWTGHLDRSPCVDEIAFLKGRKFATLVYDLDCDRVLWAGLEKGSETIDRFSNEAISKGQKARILRASSAVRCETTSIISSLSLIAT